MRAPSHGERLVDLADALPERLPEAQRYADPDLVPSASDGRIDAATLKRLRTGVSNKSDLGGVLQTNNIYIATCTPGQTSATIAALRASPATAKGKARFILATDGETLEAEDLTSDDPPVACAYPDFHDHFGFRVAKMNTVSGGLRRPGGCHNAGWICQQTVHTESNR